MGIRSDAKEIPGSACRPCFSMQEFNELGTAVAFAHQAQHLALHKSMPASKQSVPWQTCSWSRLTRMPV
jgi:hypothetical protein